MTDPTPTACSSGLSRRRLLGAVGGLAVAAGTGALAGCTSGPAKAANAYQAAAGASANTGDVNYLRQFVSRPDLQPIAAEVRTSTQETAPGLIFAAPYGGGDQGQQGPMIVDNSGQLVWFRPLANPENTQHRAYNFRVQQYQGEPVLTWYEGKLTDGHGEGHYGIADSSYRIRWVEAGNGYAGDLHEFLLTAEGTALFTCYVGVEGDLSGVGGPRNGSYLNVVVQEVDVATGRVVFQWMADENVSFAESYQPMAQAWWDPYHLNSIAVAPDGNLLFSVRNTWTVYKVDRSTGKILWRLGGKHSDFAISPEATFAWQHHVTQYPGGRFTVFDNAIDESSQHAQSHGLLLSVDEDERTVTLIDEYRHDPPVSSTAMGSVQLLADGHVLVGWGDSHYATEYDQDGTVIHDLSFGDNSVLNYRAFRSPWTGRPLDHPALAVRNEPAGITLYVSWNGDTQVRHWQVLLGDRPESLSPAATVTRDGFETVISVSRTSVSRRARYVAVAGLDGSGHEIGRSAVASL